MTMQVSYEQIVQKLQQEAGLSQKQIEDKINQKIEQLSGLISKDGAAHIIANEYGVKIFEQQSGRLQIGNILAGMRNVEVVGRVKNVFEVREFQTENRSGKVGSFVVADETGSMRVVLWGSQTDIMRDMNPNDIVKIKGGYTKENSGRKEIHVGERADIALNPPGESVPELSDIPINARKKINELNENDADVEIMGTVVQVFEPKFFEVCSQCSKRARPREDKYVCDTHGAVTPEYSYVLNVFLDDGSDNIRVVCFRQQAEQILKKTREEILQLRENPDLFSSMQTEMLGNIVKFSGRVTKNAMFDRLEFAARNVEYPDPEKEIKRLEQEVGK